MRFKRCIPNVTFHIDNRLHDQLIIWKYFNKMCSIYIMCRYLLLKFRIEKFMQIFILKQFLTEMITTFSFITSCFWLLSALGNSFCYCTFVVSTLKIFKIIWEVFLWLIPDNFPHEILRKSIFYRHKTFLPTIIA